MQSPAFCQLMYNNCNLVNAVCSFTKAITSYVNDHVCHATIFLIQLPMSRSQSERSARISYEKVTRQMEPPKRQSDIVRSTRTPAYENSFHVQRPNSFDVRDLQADPSRCVGHGYISPNKNRGSSATLSFIRFRTLLPSWMFYTSADLLLFVPLSRHLPVLRILLPRSLWTSAFFKLNFCFLIKMRIVPGLTQS